MMEVRNLSVDDLSQLSKVRRYSDIDEVVSWYSLFIKRELLEVYGVFTEDILIGKINIAYAYVPGVCEDQKSVIRNRRVFIYDLVINENFKGQGLGNLLLTKVTAVLDNKNLEASVSIDNLSDKELCLYNRYGFTQLIRKA